MTDRICNDANQMQTNNQGDSKKQLLSLEEQLEQFAEIIVDIYFETIEKIDEDEKQYTGEVNDANVCERG